MEQCTHAELTATIDDLRARQVSLEEICSYQWRKLSTRQVPSEGRARELMELAGANSEVAKLRRMLTMRMKETDEAMENMRNQVSEGEQARARLVSTIALLRDQLQEMQSRQTEVEFQLSKQESDIARREQVIHTQVANIKAEIHAREAEHKGRVEEESASIFFDYIKDAWAHYADGNTERCLYWLQKAASTPNIDPSLSKQAWFSMGGILSSREDDTVVVGGTAYTQIQCFLKALQMNPNDAAAWYNFGTTLPPKTTTNVGGTIFASRQCFMKALEINSNFGAAWHNLGTTLSSAETARVGQVDYTNLQCFVKALELSSRYAAAWHNLGIVLSSSSSLRTVDVGGARVTSQQCFIHALEIDLQLAPPWYQLSTTLASSTTTPPPTITIDNVSYTKQQCLLRALGINPTMTSASAAWYSLSTTLHTPGDTVKLEGVSYTKQHCIVRSLEIDPSVADGWYSLGATLSPNETITMGSATLTQKECFVKALSIDPRGASAWLSPDTAVI